MSGLFSTVHILNEGWGYLLIGACAALGTYRVLSHVYTQSEYDVRALRSAAALSRQERTHRARDWGRKRLNIHSILDELASDFSSNSDSTGREKQKGSGDGPGEWSTTEDLVVQSMDSLTKLALYSDYKMRIASSELLFDFAMRKSTLGLILRTVSDTHKDKQAERFRALLILLAMVQSPPRVARLIRAGVIPILVDGMRDTDNKEICIHAAAIISSLINHHDDKIARKCRSKASECGLLETVYETLMLTSRDSGFNFDDDGDGYKVEFTALHREGCKKRVDAMIVAICTEIAKTYSLQIDSHEKLIQMGYLCALLSAAKQSPANLDLMRTVMEALVRLCTYINISTIVEVEPDPTTYMAALLEHGAVDVITSCIRHIEADVSSWGIILMHEFTVRSLGRKEFAETPGIVRWMCRRISTDNYDLNQRIFRALWYLCSVGATVIADVAQPANLRRVLGAIKTTDDKDLKFWCITLVNRVATQPSSHRCIVDSSFLRTFPALIEMDDPDFNSRVLPEMAELISRLCNSITLAPLLHSYPIVSSISYMLLKSNSSVAKLAMVVAIIRTTSRSRNYLTMFVDNEIINRIIHLVGDFSKDVIQNYSAKCLVALLYSDMVSKSTVFFSGLVPYLSRLNHIYCNDVGSFFCKDFVGVSYTEDSRIFENMTTAWPKLTIAGIGMSFNTLDNQLESARVLFSAMQLYLAECKDLDGHFLSDKKVDTAVNEFLNFQLTLLAQLAMYLMRYFDMWDDVQSFLDSHQASSINMDHDVALAFRRVIRAPRAREQHARASVNTFVMAYYLRNQDDPHFRAAAKDNKTLLCRNHIIRMRASSPDASDMSLSSPLSSSHRPDEISEGRWTDVSGRIKRKSKYVRSEPSKPSYQDSGDAGDKEPEFTGILRDPRMRCLLPALYLVLDAFADSLGPGLVIQSPVVTQRALWIMRIFYNEFPDLRGLVMRVLSSIDLKTLSRNDATELVDLCSKYVVDTAISSSNLILAVDREDIGAGMTEVMDIVKRTPELQRSRNSNDPQSSEDAEEHQGSENGGSPIATSTVEMAAIVHNDSSLEDDRALQAWLAPIAQTGISALAKLTAMLYFGKHMALHPECIATSGRFYAQFTLDRYSAGWKTCEDMYSCIEPQSVSDHGAGCWIIDRAGPRGTGQVNRINTVMRLSSGMHHNANADETQRRHWPGHASNGSSGSVQNLGMEGSGLPLISRTSSHSRRHSPSSTSSSISSSRETPSSPFLATIVSDPNIDTDGSTAVAISGPLTTLMDPPGIMYHNYSPYYPAFSALADGCTVWNAGWKFESVRTRTGVDGRLGGVHRFHIRLLSAGLVQIGWCTDQCGFFPESGVGVGDDFESVAYDGYRKRKWFGIPDKNVYGEQWKAGDVISAELDLDNGRVVFYQNGKSLGLAFGINEQGTVEGSANGFQGLSRDRTWYPAFSLSYNQGVVFLGGDNFDQQSCCSIKGGSNDGASEAGWLCKTKSSLSVSSDNRDGVEASGDRDEVPKQCVLTDQHAGLRSLGVAKAYRIRFEFQDLDTFPCIAFTLPGDWGQIILGPVTDMGNLSTYLQPQWWAVWTQPPPPGSLQKPGSSPLDVRNAAAADLSRLFSQIAQPNSTDPSLCVQSASVLTRAMRAASWVYFIVSTSGHICLATSGEMQTVLFDVGLDAVDVSGNHIWLPTVSPAVISFELVPLHV
ncbi:hypothetical protein IW140_006155 [Coemansia sp. RSA 1813]|nr:hypothetical protein LPJ74_005750 [Coemansia sp. RSA 1843]KAJ2085777.1 hypothetical protein IW138_006113 [Coemansia sp. RSA 986]KAJ2211923.1 hypothetical protein EV179_005093 [Coemansia sp. RSA 487]KAJ2563342.1 hypothetical protein IW140_006155 [Coemansia sp. RSA 1813]